MMKIDAGCCFENVKNGLLTASESDIILTVDCKI